MNWWVFPPFLSPWLGRLAHHTLACTYSKHSENPVFGEAIGFSELLINVAVEVLHPPNCLIFQLAVQGVLLLHVLRGGEQSKGGIRFLAVKSNWEPACMADIQLPWVVPGVWSWEEPQGQVVGVEGIEPLASRAKPERMCCLPLYNTATGRNVPDPHGCCRHSYPRPLSKRCFLCVCGGGGMICQDQRLADRERCFQVIVMIFFGLNLVQVSICLVLS